MFASKFSTMIEDLCFANCHTLLMNSLLLKQLLGNFKFAKRTIILFFYIYLCWGIWGSD